MTTPAQNINTASIATAQLVQRNAAGQVIDTINWSGAGARRVSVRPASVNNLRRSDGSRQPSNWYAWGGVVVGASGSVLVSDTVGNTWRTTGLITLIPDSLGDVPSVIDTTEGAVYAIRDALGHYAEAEQKFGVALRETRATVGLMTQYYRDASDLLGRVTERVVNDGWGKRGFGKAMADFARGWKSAPSRYLEYLYGIRPLADEINNAVDVLTQSRDRGSAFKMTLRGKYKNAGDVTYGVHTTLAGTNGRITYRVLQQHRASLVFQLPSWFWERLPPVTAFSEAYESASLSFVLDWLIPIKGWLRGFEGLQLRPFFTEGSTTVFLRRTGGEVQLLPGTGLQVTPLQVNLRLNDYRMERTAFFTFPTEQVMRLPRLRDSLGLVQLDAVSAMAGQRLANLGKVLTRFY